jgi:EAL domain-containing protein (putative c-di-GMP-specific phosphodiesterase class I)/CheY-like chemotaxis protein
MKSIADLAILIVEDEPLQRAFLANRLRQLGACRILEAGDGGEAIRAMAGHAVDLVFCDIGMPNMDGPQFILKQLERAGAGQLPRALPMLVWTSVLGSGMLESHVRLARTAGFAMVEALPKPLSGTSLCYVIELALALGKSRRAGHADQGKLPEINDDDLLRAMCDVDEFDVWYRPTISLESGHIRGAEAQVRWNHPKFRQLSSERFIALIEQQGLGLVLFYRTVNHVLRTQRKLQAGGHRLPLGIKASGQTLQTPEIADYLAERVRQYRLNPEHIAIVLTEAGAPVCPVLLSASLNRMRLKGFSVFLNGFGAGGANLKMLAEMPFTGICIDDSFVEKISVDGPSRGIVETILGMGRRLELPVIADGVDDEKTGEMLRGMGCDLAQGKIAPPVKASEFLRRVRSGERLGGHASA